MTKRLEASDPLAKVEFISPYDDVRVISGQGTTALELMEQAVKLTGRSLHALVVPVGGGGLLSGCAVAAKGTDGGICVIGAEPLGRYSCLPPSKLAILMVGQCQVRTTPSDHFMGRSLCLLLGRRRSRMAC